MREDNRRRQQKRLSHSRSEVRLHTDANRLEAGLRQECGKRSAATTRLPKQVTSDCFAARQGVRTLSRSRPAHSGHAPLATRGTRNCSKLALIIIIALFLLPFSLALGISPARITLPAEGPYEFTFRPILSQGESGTMTVKAEGDLAQHITFDKTELQSGDTITGTLTPPADLEPGPHAQSIVLSLQPADQATVAASAQVAAVLLLNIPYPDEYLTADWAIDRDTGNGVALVTVTLQNLGSRQSTPDIIVTISDGERTDTLPLSTTVSPGSFAKAEASYDPAAKRMPPGVYTAQLTVAYADKQIIKTRQERFGLPIVELTSIRYQDEAGDIKPIDIAGRIDWNTPVNATVQILLDGEQAMEDIFPIQGDFEHRLYLDTQATGVPQAEITVILTAEGVSASLSQDVRPARPESSHAILGWTLAALLVIAAIIWRVRLRE